MLRARQGRWQEAREALEEWIELARRMLDPHREAQARAVLGTLIGRTGQNAAAQKQVQETLAIFQCVGAQLYIERVQRVRGQPRPLRALATGS
jgi:uncharacterized protein HemY